MTEEEAPLVGASPRILLVQFQSEELEHQLAAAGYRVVHHSNNPLDWLEDISNQMSVDLVLVAPLAMALPSPLQDEITTLMGMYEGRVKLYVAPDLWLDLSLDAAPEGEV